MRVLVASKQALVPLDVLPEDATTTDLAREALSSTSTEVQPSEVAQHIVVCDGRRIRDVTRPLQKQGVVDGSTLVLLRRRAPPVSAEPAQVSHPSLEEIERVVRAEAARQGREVTTPTAPALRNRDISPFETRLHDIMQALQNMSGQGFNDTEMQRHVSQALRQAARIPREGGEAALNEEVVVPEPNPAHISQLGDMGFSSAAARRALLLNRNVLNSAANYLIAHGTDGDIEAEPTMQELREVYHARNVRLAQPRQVEASAEHMELLTSMGFTESGARHALIRNDNNLDSAINFLTCMPPGWEPTAEETQRSTEAAGEPEIASPGAAAAEQHTENNAEANEQQSTVQQDGASIDLQSGQGSDLTEEATGSSRRTRGVPAVGSISEDLLTADDQQQSSSHVQHLDETQSLPGLRGTSEGSQAPFDDTAELEMLLDADPEGGAAPGNASSGMPVENEQHEMTGDPDDADEGEEETTDERGNDGLVGVTFEDIREGMRGIMSALGGGAVDSERMSGALPILSTGSREGGMLDPLRLVDEMRWSNGFPDLLGGLMADEQEDAAMEDDFAFQTDSTAFEDDEDGNDDEVEEDEDDQEDSSADEQEMTAH